MSAMPHLDVALVVRGDTGRIEAKRACERRSPSGIDLAEAAWALQSGLAGKFGIFCYIYQILGAQTRCLEK